MFRVGKGVSLLNVGHRQIEVINRHVFCGDSVIFNGPPDMHNPLQEKNSPLKILKPFEEQGKSIEEAWGFHNFVEIFPVNDLGLGDHALVFKVDPKNTFVGGEISRIGTPGRNFQIFPDAFLVADSGAGQGQVEITFEVMGGQGADAGEDLTLGGIIFSRR